MGLYFQCYQEVPPKFKLRVAGPLSCNNDGPIHGRLREASDSDLPQTGRTRNGGRSGSM